MEAIKILQKISEQIKELYPDIESFTDWCPQNSNIEIKHNNIAYCIDFQIKNFYDIQINTTAFKKKNGKWVKFDISLSKFPYIFFEDSFSLLLIAWYMQLFEESEADKIEKENAESDYKGIQDTYDSLRKSQ